MEDTSRFTRQHTLTRSVSCSGIGLHCGERITMHLHPAAPGSGITFRRLDLPGTEPVPALVHHVVDTRLCTVLGRGEVRVATVEHLLAALAALAIDNVRVEVDGPEVPIMDGSARPFVDLLLSAGLLLQRPRRRYLAITKPLEITEGAKRAILRPHHGFSLACQIDFGHPLIGSQSFEYVPGRLDFARAIAPARTFGFEREVEAMIRAGHARGGSLENAVVLSDDGVLNQEGLRFTDEFVRHKLLDAVGDLSLAGLPILGRMVLSRSGHQFNAAVVEHLLRRSDAWVVVDALPAHAPVHGYQPHPAAMVPLPALTA